MENEIEIPSLTWLDDAFSKDSVDELEAACCLTDSQDKVYFGTEVSSEYVKYQVSQNLRRNYNAVVTWNLHGCDLLSFVNKAIAKNLPNFRKIGILRRCKDHFLRLPEIEKVKFIDRYFYLAEKLGLTIEKGNGASTNQFSGSFQRTGSVRFEYNFAPQDVTRLTANYSLLQTQKILEEAEKNNFLVYAKVIRPDKTESYVSLSSAEVTVVRNNTAQGYNTNIITRDFETNIFELWVGKIGADKLLGLTKQKSADTPLDEELLQMSADGNESSNDNQLDMPEIVKPVMEWIVKSREYADEEALTLFQKTGMQKITQRTIAPKVAARFAKEKIYGVSGAQIDAETVRRYGLKGWAFHPPIDENAE